MEDIPPHEERQGTTWVQIHTRRVLSFFISPLARAHGWNKLFLISPWISDFGLDGGMTFTQILKRLRDDDATLYVVSRPPLENWHKSALDQIASTGKANIALVPELHTKLYCADTDHGTLALVGSANFTAKSLVNRELGVMIRGVGPGKQLIQNLMYEASDIYRSETRDLFCKRKI
jgi:hypothetical protein